MSEDEAPFVPFTSSVDQWKTLKPFARVMRHVPTPAEQHLWEHLRNRQLGPKFRRQHAIEGFIVDFVCIESKVIVELDGSIHDGLDQMLYDKSRQLQLEERGYRVLRFRNEQVFAALDQVIGMIKQSLNLTPGLSPQERGATE